MWGATTYKTFYKVQGALYQGLNEDFAGGKNIFVPNDSAVVFTSFDGKPADWYRSNKIQEGGEKTPSFTFQKGFGDYAPIQIREYSGYGKNANQTKINYIYGKAAYNGTTLVVGASGMNMMSMANGYCYGADDSTKTSNIGLVYTDNKTASCFSSKTHGTYMRYGTDLTHTTHGSVQAYEMILDNPGEMYIDYVVLPIFGYPKDNTATIDKMIPDNKKVTLKLYPLSTISKDADGKYSYTKKSTPVSTKTVDAGAYTQDTTKNYGYRGTLKFKLDEPVLMTTSFVARLTWDEGCNFGLITDAYNLQNYTTWYIFNDGKYYLWTGGGYNVSISYHATFPTLDKKDTKTALNFASTGGNDDVAIKSNIDPADTEEFTIDLGGADWISMTGITYSGGTYKKSGTDTLKFEAKPNTTGKTRKATITLKHHGKELKYTVSQESMPSAFYEVPANAFFAGMTETGDTAAGCKTFYLPYNYGQEYTFKSEEGTWTKEKSSTTDKATECSYLNRTMKDSCHTPLLAVDGKVGYQYGASGESYDENLYFHIGDSVMHYMTPARLYGEYGKPTHYLSGNYKTTNYDTVGVYFNNEDVMYIDGISIPIKNSSATGVDDMFPTDDAHVIVNIYKATSAGGKSENKVDRNTRFYTDTLTKGDFKVHPDEPNRGTLNKTFEKPISGPFVVELSDMKHSGCSFTIYSSEEREGENMWGYFFNKGSRTFPGNYTPLISVHAMFPVLYGKSGEDLTIDTIPVTGSTFGDKDCPTRTIYANVKYNKLDEDGWSRKHEVTGVIMRFYNNDRTEKSTKWYFEMSPNTSGAVREGDIIFNLRGKKLAYHVTQAAPTLTPREGMDNKQTFEIPLQDDTVHINGNKVTKVYLESEVSLEDTIKVISKKGLTKIDKTFGSENGKYYVCLTFTRAKCALTDTEDTITVSFEKNANNKYEYTILHKGVGKLTTNHDYRTIVFGPQGSRSGLFLNDKGELSGTNYIAIRAQIAPLREYIRYYSDLAQDDRFYNPKPSIKNEGTDDEYLQVLPATLSNTEVKLEDNLYIFIPNVDTITFHLIQEAKARVWQHNADRDTALEVNDKGDVAHFKGRLTTKMTIVSNTPVTEGDINFEYTNEAGSWVHPSTEIKKTTTKDSVFITFNVDKLGGTEPRSTNITVSILDNEFTVPLTQKTFAIEWSNSGYDEELVVPVAGGIANWKGSYNPYLNVFGTEAYRDALLKVTAPEGVEIIRQTDTLFTGRQRTVFTFSKKDTLTADWSGEITVSFDSTNTDEGFDYHFSKTFTITQAAARVWLADDQQPLVIAAEGGESNEFTIWSNMNIQSKDWTVTKKPTWVDGVTNVSAGPDGANYYRKLKASAAANTGTEKREGTITIKHNTLTNLSVEINISQEPLPTYTREGGVGNYGTLCFPYTPTQDVTGADFYKVLWFNEAEMDLVLEKITSQPEAGVPYIFQYTADQMVWTYDNAETPVEISATGVNGLHGVASEEGYTVSPEDATAGTYLLSNNQIVKAAVESHAAQYRAYLKLSEVSTEAPAGPATAPRIHMAVPGNGAPTNLNGLNSNTKAHKILKDGQLYIIRDTKTYNAQGIEVQ